MSFGQILIDIKYARLLGSRLQRFKIKNDRPFLANFRCPYCGDSQKSKTKARGYIYQDSKDGGEVKFKCYNGCPGRIFWNFLKDQDPNLHREYVLERFKEGHSGNKESQHQSEPSESCSEEIQTTKFNVLSRIKRISDLKETHPAKEYVAHRLIPREVFDRLYYVPEFTKFVNRIVPGKLEERERDEPRLIIPFLNEKGECYGFQGRSFDPKANMRYISIMLDDTEVKMFGRERVTSNRLIYVLEGALDSLFLPNALATAQGDLLAADQVIGGRKCFIPDKDIRNPQICHQIERLIASNKDVCLLPQSVPGKDLNEMVLAGLKPEDLPKMIAENTFSGPRLKLEFINWRKT